MKKIEAVTTLLEIKDKDLEQLETGQLRDVLGSLRYVTRQVEREIVKRDMDSEMFMKDRS